MTEILDFLKTLITAPGLSGHEAAVRGLIEKAWKPLVDEIRVSRLGSLYALRRGTAPEPRPALLVAAHMDAIGMMVSDRVDGFLRITEVGGLDDRVLPGQLVIVHGREDLEGVIVQPPAHLLPKDIGGEPVPMRHLLVDTGLPAGRVHRLVRVGDLVSFAQAPVDLGGGYLAGHSLDNRASIAALTATLQELEARPHAWDLWTVATVQEEETLGGAYTSAFELRPRLAVAVDVTHAAGPSVPDHQSYPLNEGPALGWGPNIHPGLHKDFKELAERLELPHQVEVMPHHSGTDAFAMQVTAEGIPTMVLSIPLRYMHTPVELVTLKDIQRTGRLLAEFVAMLSNDYLDSLKWDV